MLANSEDTRDPHKYRRAKKLVNKYHPGAPKNASEVGHPIYFEGPSAYETRQMH